MRVASVFLCIAIIATPGLANEHRERPLELQVIRAAETVAGAGAGECTALAFRTTQKVRGLAAGSAHVTRLPALGGTERLSVVAYDEDALWDRVASLCGGPGSDRMRDSVKRGRRIGAAVDLPGSGAQLVLSPEFAFKEPTGAYYPPLEIHPLVTSGPSSNRVDLVFFSDGYLAEEKVKFLEDAQRLADDVSRNQTFNTVQPLLNFWAAFSPSNESGIGTGGKPKDTPFGLYRDGTELRAVYYSKPDVARAACLSMSDQCDFPILMGNDPLYGGLGGEFTVITPSIANGALVLRHELGHSVIDVGEEYDGGFAYFGVNALHHAHGPVSWAHWLTNTSSAPRVERAAMPLQAYPWTLLNASAPWTTAFSSAGTYARHVVRFSLSGVPAARDLTVALDGADLRWAPRPGIGADRWHYDVVPRAGALGAGLHELAFTLREKAREGTAQLCSVEVLEFGSEDEFVSSPGHYGLYPTFSDTNSTTYRPTNEDCLMRIVTTPNFCKVCTEGLWLALLQHVDLLDGVRAGCAPDPASGRWSRTLHAQLVPLAHLRAAAGPAESYSIAWYKDGALLDAFTNKTYLALDDAHGPGAYTVRVTFTTEEVLVDNDGLLSSSANVTVTDRCTPAPE